jgi:hypothetical protein
MKGGKTKKRSAGHNDISTGLEANNMQKLCTTPAHNTDSIENNTGVWVATEAKPTSAVPSDYPELPTTSKWEETASDLKLAAFILMIMAIVWAVKYFFVGG